MHIFSQVFITDVIFNSRADCKRVVVCWSFGVWGFFWGFCFVFVF